MRTRGVVLFAFLLVLAPSVLAQAAGNASFDIAGVEEKINSIVHYAEEYEVGNISYLQLNVHGHKIRAELNLLMGGGIGENWAQIPRESVEKALGAPTDYTTWLWVDNRHLNKRFEEEMPFWERIVFDGRKIRIIFNAFPSAIEKEDRSYFKYYSVDLIVKFKKDYEFDLDAMLEEITALSNTYNQTRATKDGKELVRRMLEDERIVNAYVQDNLERCVETVSVLLKPEERWPDQKMMIWRFNLYEGSDFDLVARFEECSTCEWRWLHMDFWLEGRGPQFIAESPELHLGKLEQQIDEEYYRTLSIDEINEELKKTVSEIRDEAEKFDKTRSQDFQKKIFFARFKMEQLSRILNEKYNNVQEFDKGIARRIESGELQGPGGCKNLSGCKKYCEQNSEECKDFMQALRVEFADRLFQGFGVKKTPVTRAVWDRRLVENLETRQDSWCRHVNDLQCKEDEGCVNGQCVFALGGNETCNNSQDDDFDNVVDCQDPDCWQERQCGKLCEDTCNVDGGCWQTSHDLCYSSCKECWDCGGDEKCKGVCEPECWPCNERQEIKAACDDCWTCEDEAYGGCYVACKPCEECNIPRKEKIKAIFDRAMAGQIQLPGACSTEEECNKYCAAHGEECGNILTEIGLHSEELDCSQECRDCSVCNHDLGNFKCNENQQFDSSSGQCVCIEGSFDCDADWQNGCESTSPCYGGPCFEECSECDACGTGEECTELCEECHSCRNPAMPTYICDGIERLEPCEVEYICNGVKQNKPCKAYVCDGREYSKPCDDANRTCGENQLMAENKCVCRAGFKDCDNDGDCESTKACGFEICDDGTDNNDNGFVDCEDLKCSKQVCRIEEGKEFYCFENKCLPPEEMIPIGPEPVCGNHWCEPGEDKESCKQDCIVCEAFEPPDCPNGKIVWKGKDEFGCSMQPLCVVTEKACSSDGDCAQPKCGVSKCINSECKVTELTTECEEGCSEGRTKKRECADGSEITTAICSASQWLETGNDCPEALPGQPEAPEIEEPNPEAKGECVLAEDCGGQQDVCSNGSCVALPIPAEERKERPKEVGKPEEKPAEELPPEQPAPEEAPEAPPQPEIPEASPEQPEAAEQSPATGNMLLDFVGSVTGWVSALFAGEEEYPCTGECKPCEECNQKFDQLIKKIQAGEIQGVGGCKNRAECEEYCGREQNKQECSEFAKANGLQTINCWWEFCRECDKCRYNIGEFQCNQNQRFNLEQGYCECNEEWFDCDGDWENGCESAKKCGACESKADCAADRCAPWGNVIQQFDCFKGEEWVEEKGAVRVEASCHLYPTEKREGGIYFDMWGYPFEELRPMREEAKIEMGQEWCEWEMENLIKERLELQNSLSKDFLKWFFEEYVPSSPSEWEKHIGGIYDSYWRFVNNSERTSEMLLCLGRDKLPEEYKPVDVSYDTDFGSVRIWEQETTTDFFGKRRKIISTYMRIWVFPPKDFVKKQMQDAMDSGLMPGPEGSNEPELSPAEIESAKKDKELMKFVNSISSKYGGEAKFLLNIVDGQETVFNALITVNPDIIMKAEPIRDYAGGYDAKITMDFDFFYDLVQTTEKDIRGGETMYPPWETGVKIFDAIKGAVDGVRIWWMITSATLSGKIKAEPAGALSDGLDLLRMVFERGPPGEKKE